MNRVGNRARVLGERARTRSGEGESVGGNRSGSRGEGRNGEGRRGYGEGRVDEGARGDEGPTGEQPYGMRNLRPAVPGLLTHLGFHFITLSKILPWRQ